VNVDGDSQISPGLTLAGRYTVLNAISAGAMGAVFRAHDSEEGREVALKRLTDTRHGARFDIEARLLSALRHPRVVRVLDHFDEPSGRYIVMELIEGQDLGALLKKRGDPGLPLSDALDYAREACEALQYVHEQQIVHRDVKPQNLIDSSHGVVLVDFGVAREMAEEDSGGTVGIGTPRFMAPEVFAGGTVSPRSDVFGIAATLWTLITGKPPVYAEPTKLIDVCPEVSPSLERTIRAGLEMIPERRVASIGAFAKALGAPLTPARGRSLALSVDQPDAPRSMMEAIVRTAAGVFEAAASSISLTDATTGELVYQSAWGAGAREIVGVRLPPGTGISGAVIASGEGQAVRDCRSDPRFAAQIAAGTGYVPRTMVVVPLMRAGSPIGALSVLDRRDGGFYTSSDLERALMFAELAVTALDVQPDYFTSLGQAAG
jgi:putative methionine-R-sulfoxide reductase with GAF domain